MIDSSDENTVGHGPCEVAEPDGGFQSNFRLEIIRIEYFHVELFVNRNSFEKFEKNLKKKKKMKC